MMKKSVTILLSILLFISCNDDINLGITNSSIQFSTSTNLFESRGIENKIEHIKADTCGFGVLTYHTQTDWATNGNELLPNLMNRTKIKYSNNCWTYDDTKYWPDDGKISVFAYYPYNLLKENYNKKGLPEINYTIDNDVKLHEDILAASCIDKTRNEGTINVTFKHLLSKIGFTAHTAKEYDEKIGITKVTLFYKEKGVHNSGTFTFGKDSTNSGTWIINEEKFFSGSSELLTEKKNLSYNTDTQINDSNKYIFIIPQTLSKGDLYLNISYNVGDKTCSRNVNLFASQDNYILEKNKQYTFNLTLSLNEISVEDISVDDYREDNCYTITYMRKIAQGIGEDKYSVFNIANVYNGSSVLLPSFSDGYLFHNRYYCSFKGWSTNCNDTIVEYKANTLYTPNKNTILYPIFEEATKSEIVDLTTCESSNCYIINPSIDDNADKIYYIPIKDRIEEYWNDYSKKTLIITNDNWYIKPLWYDCPKNPFSSSTSEESRISIDKVTSINGNNINAIKVTVPYGYKNYGNILVCVYGNEGEFNKKTLWSWHLWITDYNPDSQMEATSDTCIFKVNSGEIHRYKGEEWDNGIYQDSYIMDRNIGALSPGFAGKNTPGVLYYQFGRKDPFPNESAKNPIDGTMFSIEKAPSDNVNIDKAVFNPQIFFYNNDNSNGNWLTTSLNENKDYFESGLIWADKKSKGNSNKKSIFDPSPLGWKIPNKNPWLGFTAKNFILKSSQRIYNSFARYPLAGCRSYKDGKIAAVDVASGVWYGEAKSYNKVYYLGFSNNSTNDVRNNNEYFWAHGIGVRPIKE